MTDPKSPLVLSLRKIAKKLREKGDDVDKKKRTKCAHILVAANGLAQLQKRILEGK